MHALCPLHSIPTETENSIHKNVCLCLLKYFEISHCSYSDQCDILVVFCFHFVLLLNVFVLLRKLCLHVQLSDSNLQLNLQFTTSFLLSNSRLNLLRLIYK
ncbi:hypothetical protein MN116_006233 [Schistosoma mekongi]|uniref:Uncharacterized protein n=1 Tax=Schistosoma mekongi TaxID=38744 RepID=A0AAE1ZC54_SCHME|nr:hypothetical protein MN116_006233 [Schistosoma mekongi]